MAYKKLGRPRKPKIYIRKRTPRADPPLTSEKTLVSMRKKTNAENKARSKAMETRIAKVLHGRRIPMSGAAAAFKGDVEVLFENYPGKYIIECKLSAQIDKETAGKDPFIPIRLDWFPKITSQASDMNAKFGILIIHYVNHGNDFVFVKESIIQQLITRYESPYADILTELLRSAPVIDMRFKKNGFTRTGFLLYKKALDTGMIQVQGFSGIKALTPDDTYLVLQLSTWRMLVADL